VIRVSRDEFEALVDRALESLPEALAGAMDNVAVVVEDSAPGGNLYGLYQGIPLTKRSSGYAGVMPDRITIFQDTISAHVDTPEQLAAQVRKTVLHEVAHHFGISDPRLEELGWA
jgi:predicted Zn-dependent protease with MMP-like domain